MRSPTGPHAWIINLADARKPLLLVLRRDRTLQALIERIKVKATTAGAEMEWLLTWTPSTWWRRSQPVQFWRELRQLVAANR